MTQLLIDLDSIRNTADLLAVIGNDTQLRLKGNSPHGKEYAGPCPLCGQAKEDGFVVQPENTPPTWFCRKCTGAANKTAIDYVAMREGLDPNHLTRADLEKIAEIINGSVPTLASGSPAVSRRESNSPAIPPDQQWQVSALAFITWSQDQLWSKAGESALHYLRNVRKLEDRTIRRFMLGYNPQKMLRPAEKWGSPHDNPEPLTLWQGIVIPWIAKNQTWAINIRQDHPKDPKDRYKKVRGSRKAIFNADDLPGADSVLFCEGELDAMAAWQQVNDIMAVVTFGGATNTPDLGRFGLDLLWASERLAIYDNDDAGRDGIARLTELIPTVRDVQLPAKHKDLGEFHQAGGDLYRLIEPYLQPITFPSRDQSKATVSDADL